MKSVRTGIAAAILVLILVGMLSSAAFAYFSTKGAGDASAGVSKLSTLTTVTTTPAVGGTVALSWSAVVPPGVGTVTYAVSRDGGAPSGACPSASARTPVTSCTDSGLNVGSYSYVVTAYWRSWSASSSTATAKITVGQATHLDLKATSTTPTAGATNSLTITAQDANDNTVTTYTGSRNLTFSGALASPSGTNPTVSNSSGTAIAFGSVTAISFSSGVAKVSSAKNGVMRLYRSGATSVKVTDGSISSSPDLSLTVGLEATPKISLVAASATPTAGAATDLTITASDTYGNPLPTYTGPRSLTFTGASPSAWGNTPTVSDNSGIEVPIGSATTIDFNAGVAKVAGAANGALRLYKSGSTSLKVSDGTLTSASTSVTVAAAAASSLSLAAALTTLTAGGTNSLTTTAFDPYGNTATSYTGTRNLTFSGALASPSGTNPTVSNSSGTAIAFGSVTAISFSSGVAKVSSAKNGVMKLNRAGATSVVVSDGTISSAPLSIAVNPGSPSRLAFSSVEISGGILSSICALTCSVTGLGNSGTIVAKVSVTDSLANTVSALGTGNSVKVTTTGGAIAGSPMTINNPGPAESATQFTFTARSTGAYTETITAATSAGTTYTSATLTATR